MLPRAIKSFVKRSRELSLSKQKVFDELWPKYKLDSAAGKIIDLTEVFNNDNEVILEIGFGNGETIFHLAKNNPTKNFIGVEVHKPGVANLLGLLRNCPLDNLRIYADDAVDFIHGMGHDNYLAKILILFPDPWPKKRHHKRRLIQSSFVQNLSRRLKVGGILHFATDWEEYAIYVDNVIKDLTSFRRLLGDEVDQYQRPLVTKFEKRGISKNHNIFDLIFVKPK